MRFTTDKRGTQQWWQSDVNNGYGDGQKSDVMVPWTEMIKCGDDRCEVKDDSFQSIDFWSNFQMMLTLTNNIVSKRGSSFSKELFFILKISGRLQILD